MRQRTTFARSCSRIAEDMQLQAEEEFMVYALKKIRQQINCLQIERLHLESLKQRLENPGWRNNTQNNPQPMEEGESPEPSSSTHTIASLLPTNPTHSHPIHSKPPELMSAVDMMTLGSKLKNASVNMDDDVRCNTEELNLNLTTLSPGPSTSKPVYTEYEYDSDEASSSDASDGDDVMIDINMLMNGTSNFH